MNRWHAVEGAPNPLGATWIAQEQSYNFALYSKHATGVVLLLYSERDVVNPVFSRRLTYPYNKTGRIWHCRVQASDAREAKFYAYSVEGPFEPAEGHRFDPHKILLDPCARVVFFPTDFSREAASHPGSNAGRAPLGTLPSQDGAFDWGDESRPEHTHDTIIYELHVRGFTQSPTSGVSNGANGTYQGLIEKIPYLTKLGVTAVELMPVQQRDPDERSYWGYMPLGFFAPEIGYARRPNEAVHEFKSMVKAFHAAGIEVILDVVFNHTTELDDTGPTYSFRGIDNTTYYLLKEDRARYRDDCGTGNVLHCGNRYVRGMILDSMRYWVHEMHVDGFRFDLASIFTRDNEGQINLSDPPIISEITADPDFAGIRLIAESWDLASYQLGRSFPGVTWLQWNAKFRDDVRAFVRGDGGTVSSVMTRFYGSDDIFPDQVTHAYHAYQSVNFVTSHDGFCMYDLVSYNAKHNKANGENGVDGTDNNLSWNCGWEGDDGVPLQVLELRKRQIKNMCCILMLSNGTPMFVAGDEFMRTQKGNNNPYNQDNETSWVDWSLLEKNHDVFCFFHRMIAFRKAHPSLCRSRFWRDDVSWYGQGAQVDQSAESHSLAFLLRGASQGDIDIYAMINASETDKTFRIQHGASGSWCRVVDTSLASPEDISEQGREPLLDSLDYLVRARSVVALMAR